MLPIINGLKQFKINGVCPGATATTNGAAGPYTIVCDPPIAGNMIKIYNHKNGNKRSGFSLADRFSIVCWIDLHCYAFSGTTFW